MQKIRIRHFGPIKEVEIAIDKVLLLIGEQASGKSTTAKLIYFFRSLPDVLRSVIYENYQIVNQPQTLVDLFEQQITKKFIEYFGIEQLTNGSTLEYWYSIDDRAIELAVDGGQVNTQVKGALRFQMSNRESRRLLADLKNYFSSTKDQDEIYRERARHDLDKFVADLFGYQQTLVYYPAGRGVAVTYSDSVKLTFFGNLAAELRSTELQHSTKGDQVIDLILMTNFLRQSEKFKARFNNHDLSTLGKERRAFEKGIDTESFLQAQEQITKILKGRYRQEASVEKIYFSDDKSILLSHASSGQQEVIRLLQDIFLILLDQEDAFRIIEEPEAHLWPMAQKYVIELLALLLNQTQSEIVITTHSPYILSVFNNLLYATRVATLNGHEKEVSDVIDRRYWIDPQSFNIYFLSEGTCQSVMDKRLGMIDQNLLDEISEVLGDEFDTLYTMRARAH